MVVLVGSASAGNSRHTRLLAPPGACGRAADQTGLSQLAADQVMLCLTNYARSVAGLRPLIGNSMLDQAGQAKLHADLACGEFSHTPCGQAFGSVFSEYVSGAGSYLLGENLAWTAGRNATPRETIKLWLQSSHHRANILAADFRELGIGYLYVDRFLDYRDVTLWSQEFGTRSRAAARPVRAKR